LATSLYSEKLVAGTRQRFSGPSQRRQCGEAVLRMLVLMPGNCGGVGMPQRAIVNSRCSPSGRTIGAILSGKIAGKGGRLPAVSSVALNRSRMAFWFVVIE
jgi:hypothetical protein